MAEREAEREEDRAAAELAAWRAAPGRDRFVERDEFIRRDATPYRVAQARARALLLTFLKGERRAEFECDGRFTMPSALHPGRVYRVNGGSIVGNIEVIEGDRVLHRLCVHPDDYTLPMADVMLAQLAHLATPDGEREMLRVANIHPARHG